MQSSENKKKYIVIAELILDDIRKGYYKVGDNIPPIRQLAQKYDANPQTVNKATSHLATLGYLEPRQGSGSVVIEPDTQEEDEIFIPMLIDSSRSRLLDQPDSPLSYHSKDIYLSYLMNMNRLGHKAKFFIYEKDKTEINTALQDQISSIDGVIVQGSLPESYFKYLTERNIPLILINREPPEGISGKIGSIAIDTANINQMMNYLISLNHKKILYCQSDEYDENFIYFQRKKAAEDALNQWRNDLDVELREFRFNPNGKSSLDEFEKLKKEGYTAAISYNDVSALGLYGLLLKLNVRIPFDFSIAGFDDIFASQLATPPLTTVRVNRPKLVSMAIEMFDKLRLAEDDILLKEVLPTELVLRKSTFTVMS